MSTSKPIIPQQSYGHMKIKPVWNSAHPSWGCCTVEVALWVKFTSHKSLPGIFLKKIYNLAVNTVGRTSNLIYYYYN